MPTEFFYTRDGQPAETPVGTAQLKQLAASGQLKPEDLVWQEGMPNWIPASSVKGLFSSAKSTSGEIPVPARSSARNAKLESKTDTAEVESKTDAAKVESKTDAGSTAKPDERPAPGDEGLNPALVLLLTVLTVGIFGVCYALYTGANFRARFGTKTTDAAGRPLGVVRHPVVVLALTWLTFGYYLSWWVSKVMQECADFTGQPDVQSRRELSLMLIVPFYTVYLAAYRVPEMVRRVQTQAGVADGPAPSPPGLYLTAFLFLSVPILCMHHQDALNKVWIAA